MRRDYKASSDKTSVEKYYQTQKEICFVKENSKKILQKKISAFKSHNNSSDSLVDSNSLSNDGEYC